MSMRGHRAIRGAAWRDAWAWPRPPKASRRTEQLEQVRAEGCTEMQGFYFCEPSPANVIARLFQLDLKIAASGAA